MLLGRPADATLTALAAQIAASGDWTPLIALVNASLGARANLHGSAALIVELAEAGFGLELSLAEAAALAAPIDAGISTWADLIASVVLDLGGALGETLANRADASIAFTQALIEQAKGQLYAGRYLEGAAANLLRSISAADEDAAQGLQALLALVDQLSGTGVAGVASDGRIAGASVSVDANGNGLADGGEAVATTLADGGFVVASGSAGGGLLVTGGLDILTKSPVVATLQAPAGATVVTGLTGLVQALVAPGAGSSVVDAAQAVVAALGLPSVNLLSHDPIGVFADRASSDAALAEALAVEAASVQVTNLVSQAAAAFHAATPLSTGQASALVWSALARAAGRGPMNLGDANQVAAILGDAVEVLIGSAMPAATAALVDALASTTAAVNRAAQNAHSILDLARIATVGQGEMVSAIATGFPANLAQLVSDFTGTALADAIARADHGTLMPNVAPEGRNSEIEVTLGDDFPFNAAQFGFTDPDRVEHLTAVRIDSLPSRGMLLLHGDPVRAGDIIPAAELAALLFRPSPDLS